MDTFINRAIRTSALALTLAATALPGHAAQMVVDDFNDGTLNPLLETPLGGYAESGGTIFNVSNQRRNVRTVDSDYNTVDFVFEVDVTLSGTDIAFIGFGEAQPNGFWQEPLGTYFRIHTSSLVGGRVDVVSVPPTGAASGLSIGNQGGNGTHRSRITKTGSLLTFELDQFFNGSFVADGSHVVDLTGTHYDASNSHLFFGAQRNSVRFDNLNIQVSGSQLSAASVPAPATAALLAGALVLMSASRRRAA